jgi:2-methylcitrate dehydratase
VLGTDIRTTVEGAAFANSGLIRYLDWNDTYLSKEPGHPSDNLGAVLAACEAYDLSGRDVLLGTVMAYELHCQLCDAASLRKNGFDHVNYGLVSSTLAVGTLAGLNRDELVQAVNIAVNGHVALRQARAGELTEWKGLAFGNVCRNAVVAVDLAREGIQGPNPIFEGEVGFFNQLSGEFNLDPGAFGEGGYNITETYVKYYPVEYHAQAAVNCVFSIQERTDFDWDEIDRIENETYEAAVSIIADQEKWRPETRETADHSMPYCIARAFIDSKMELDQFASDKLSNPEVRSLMDRIEIVENEQYTAVYGEQFPHEMRVEVNGEIYTESADVPKGHFNKPLSRDELVDKFTTAALTAGGALSREDVEAIYTTVDDLERQDDLTDLYVQLRP